jgi:hypothetical protein
MSDGTESSCRRESPVRRVPHRDSAACRERRAKAQVLGGLSQGEQTLTHLASVLISVC